MNRKRLHMLALCLWVLLAGAGAFANPDGTAIDPMIRSQGTATNYDLTVSLLYIPDGDEGLTLDGSGVSTYTLFKQQLVLPIRLRYHLTETFSFSTSITPSLTHIQTARSQNGQSTTSSDTITDMNNAVGFRYRFSPIHSWDPTIAVSVGIPVETFDAGISGTWIGDPVVLSASLAHAAHLPTGQHRLTLSGGTAFYVNDRIRFQAGTQHVVPVGHVALPAWSASIGVIYALDPQRGNDLSLGIVRTKRGNAAEVGLKLEWHKRLEL